MPNNANKTNMLPYKRFAFAAEAGPLLCLKGNIFPAIIAASTPAVKETAFNVLT
jgi:hypothetical protein